MLTNPHDRWKKARCIYLGNTPCGCHSNILITSSMSRVLLSWGKSNLLWTTNQEVDMLTHAQNANGNMISWWCMLGNYWYANACYLNPRTDVRGEWVSKYIFKYLIAFILTPRSTYSRSVHHQTLIFSYCKIMISMTWLSPHADTSIITILAISLYL